MIGTEYILNSTQLEEAIKSFVHDFVRKNTRSTISLLLLKQMNIRRTRSNRSKSRKKDAR